MGRRMVGLRLVAVTAAIASVAACRQLVGITDNPPEDLTSTLCGLPYGTSVCASCVSTNCCAESATCAADTVCSAYEGCLGKCNGDPKCRSQCTIDDQGDTSPNVSALSACLASECETACGLGCGALAGYISEPASATSCQSCIETTTNACTHARTCGSSAECDAYWRCVLACRTEDCRLTCATDHADGAALFATFQPDYATTCSSECAFGNYWACVGHVNWPAAKSTTVNVTLPIIDTGSKAGVAGLDVSFCNGCPCNAVLTPILASGKTDADGGITLPSVQQVIGDNGVAAIDCVQITSPSMSYLPTFAYFWGPLSEPVYAPSATTQVASFSPQTVTPAAYASIPGETTPDTSTRGFVGISVHDCLGSPAPGVQITTDSNDPLVSVSYNLTGVDAGATPSTGGANVLHVPPGLLTLTATPIGLGSRSSVRTVNVAAGTITEVALIPTPLSP